MIFKVKLGLVSDIIMGQSPPGKTYNTSTNGTPLLNGPTEFGEFHPTPKTWTTAATKVCKAGDLLFCVRGSSVGRMNWADREYCIGRGLCAIRGKGKDSTVDTRFIYYALVTSLPNLLNLSHGTVFPDISKEDISNFEIKWYNDDIRAQISNILSTIDEKIKVNNIINSTLEQIVQTLFKLWFIDFEFPNEEGKRYKSSGGEMVESELGNIPKHFTIGCLGDIAENPVRTVSPQKIPSATPYVGLEHIPRKTIALREWGTADHVSSNKYLFYKDEILFGKLRPYFHKVVIAPINGICSTDILVITPKQSRWYGIVLSHLSSTDFIRYTDATSNGTRMPRTNWHDMSRYKMVLPSEELAARFTTLIQPFVETIRINIVQSSIISSLRNLLLSKFLSGDIRIYNTRELMRK